MMMLQHKQPTEVPLNDKPPSWVSRPTLAAYLKHKFPIPWEDVDEGCKRLIDALSPLPGVTTTSSCSGHSKREFHIGPSEDIDTADAIAECLERYFNQVVDGTLKI